MKIKNRINAIKIVENLILGFIKFYILTLSMLGANLDDYLFSPTNFEKILIVGNEFVIVILLDLIVNFIIFRFINRDSRIIKYKNLLYVSLMISLIEFIFLLVTGF